VLTLTAITSGAIDRSNAKRIDSHKVAPGWPVVRKGTILITRGNGSRNLVGACVLVQKDEPRLIPPDTAWVLEMADGHSARFLVEFLRSPRGRKAIHEITRGSSGIWKISQGSFMGLKLPSLHIDVEKAVDLAATAFDSVSEALAEILAAKRNFKSGLLQQLLTGQKRFPEFRTSSWEMGRFDSLCEELLIRNGKRLGPDSVMGVIKGIGFEPMRKRVRGKGELSRYKIVPPGAFAYNPMRLNIGSIAYNRLGREILVSPDYEVFQAREGAATPEFIDQLRNSWYWNSFMKRAGAGSVRVRIYFQDLACLRIPTPSATEQAMIAATLGLADTEIDQLGHLRELIETQKRGLLSRLLSGELKVPE
jgi:type I restriction enzyme S subunit